MKSNYSSSGVSPRSPDLFAAGSTEVFKIAHRTRKSVYLVLNLPRKPGQRAAVWIAGESRGTRFERRGTADAWAEEFNGVVITITNGKG